MSWTSLKISPGLVRSTTRYATAGTWFDGSLVRFRDGFPEKWEGWQDSIPGFVMQGIVRSLHRHSDLAGFTWVSAGSSKRFYMITADNQHDVTPYDPLSPTPIVSANSLSTTNGSNTVRVTHVNHLHFPGDSVEIAGAASVGGISNAYLNGVHEIVGYVDSDHYTVNIFNAGVPVNATSTVTNSGGGGITIQYIFHAGTDDYIAGGGWGSLAWNEEEWGGDADDIAAGLADQMGIWSQDNWGEDLVACAMSGPIFLWDATVPTNKMVSILNLPGADGNAPTEAQFIIVSHRDRHLLAFGASVYAGGGLVEPMTFRWCSQENLLNWNEADLAGTAGSLPLSNGSKFIAGIATAREILAWTDQALYSIQFIGAPLMFSAELLDRWSDIAGMKAVCTFNGIVYWMGRGGFYAYSGRTEKLPCPIWNYISARLNHDQFAKVYASSNQNFNEVIWFYPSVDSPEIDSYATLNVTDGVWTFGDLSRTAWLDLDALHGVIAVSAEARLYEHDLGADDGSTNPATPIPAFIESGPIELSSEGTFDKGDRMMFVRRVLPDVTFRMTETASTAPSMNLVFKMQDKPGGGFGDSSSSPVQRIATVPIEEFTEECYVRLRGRSLTFRAESNSLGTNWRLGMTRIDARTDGQR
jgi:hypothetical protein